jgi:hypothetical protein
MGFIDGMPDDTPTKWSMGLSGGWGTLANLSAMGLICVAFWIYLHQTMKNAEEDREALRQQLHETQKNLDDAHKETIQLYRSILGMQNKNVSTLNRIEKTATLIASQPNQKPDSAPVKLPPDSKKEP